MSLFQDDFYSTKVSRRSKWVGDSHGGFGGSGGARRGSQRRLWLTAGAAGGVLLLGLAVYALGSLFSGIGGSGDSGAGGRLADGGSTGSGAAVQGGGGASAEDRVVDVAARMRPAVVSILSTFQDDAASGGSAGYGLGSGVIFEKSGGKARIVTNNHVVEGASTYEVVLSDGSRKPAKVLGMDARTDLAVMEVDGGGIGATAEFGNSDEVQAGQTALSIGNPLGTNFAQTVTKGIISSPKVTIPVSLGKNGDLDWEMDVIQTDAAINQGNSGGALVDLDGRVIGINSMKIPTLGVEGMGFAIPINDAKPIIEMLIKDHKVTRPYMGVVTQDLQDFGDTMDALKLPSDVKAGAVVVNTVGPAQNAGLKMNDVIVSLDDQPIEGQLALRKFLYQHKKVGDKLKVTYYRSGKKTSVTLVLEELKESNP